MCSYVAAQFVLVAFVFEVNRFSFGLADLGEPVLFESHQRLVDGEFEVDAPVEPPASDPSSQFSRPLAISSCVCPIVKASVLTAKTSTPLSASSSWHFVDVVVVVLHQRFLDVSAAVG